MYSAKIAVIVPVHNRKETTLTFLSRINSISDPRYELSVILIDDGSTDGTASAVFSSHHQTTILRGDGNLWWAGGVNLGLHYVDKHPEFEYIMLANDDTEFNKNTVDVLFETIIAQPPRTLVSSVALDADTGKVFCAGNWIVGFLLQLKPLHQGISYPGELPEYLECDSVSSRFVIFPRQLLTDAGFFDQKKFPHHHSDLEYFLRAKLTGYNVLATLEPSARIQIGSGCGLSATVIGAATEIVLEEDVLCGANVTITDTDWHGIHPQRRRAKGRCAPVHIGKNVWLGLNVTVLKGVTIGENTIVGASSTVSIPLPANVIAAGQPARVIRSL